MELRTKFKLEKPAHDVFEAFVDPNKIGNFWFSSSSERWASGKSITLRYDEYNAVLEIKMKELEENKKIVFQWGPVGEETTVSILFNEMEGPVTIVEAIEAGFSEDDPELISKLVGQKEGWVFVLSSLKAYLENGVNQLRTGLVKD